MATKVRFVSTQHEYWKADSSGIHRIAKDGKKHSEERQCSSNEGFKSTKTLTPFKELPYQIRRNNQPWRDGTGF